MELEGRVIAITGGASGIGLALAEYLFSQGASVSLADVSTDSLDEAAQSITSKFGGSTKGKVFTAKCDVRSVAEVRKWLQDTVQNFGRLDGGANFAGVLRMAGPFVEHTEEDFDLSYEVNVKGVAICMQEELKFMKRGGSIVNASSLAGIRGAEGAAAYCMSKHAVSGLTKAVAKEYGPQGIRINAVAPGFVDTPMLKNFEQTVEGGKAMLDAAAGAAPMQRRGTPMEIAKIVAFLMSDASSYVTGAIWSTDGGMAA